MFLDRMPVRVGVPSQKQCETRKEALDRINRHNGVSDVYVSLYNGKVVDKIAWDFDVDPDTEDHYDDWSTMLSDFRKLTNKLDDDGWSQMSVLSGGGMHKYLKTKPERLEHPRDAIRQVQRKYQDELELRTDESIFGDFMRIMRVPNTYHPGAQRFCIPLEPDEVFLPKDELVELAQSQRSVEAVTGGNLYPIGTHDSMTAGSSAFRGNSGTRVPGDFNPAEVEPEGIVFPIYPCIANILKNWRDLEQKGHGIGFRRRFLIILHLKETGHEYEETVSILKKYMSQKEFRHCVYDEKQVRQIYSRDDMLFPRCESLENEIPCIHRDVDPCEKRNDLYI